MAALKKPLRAFRKLKGIEKRTDDYATAHNRRPFIFSMTFRDGSKVESQGTVRPEDCERLAEIFQELMDIAKK